LNVENMVENEDGSATMQLDLSAEEVQLLIEHAIQDLLKKAVSLNELRTTS
jgi:hypothetical protein